MIKAEKGEVSVSGTRSQLHAELATIIVGMKQEGILNEVDMMAIMMTSKLVDKSVIKIDIDELKKQMEGDK